MNIIFGLFSILYKVEGCLYQLKRINWVMGSLIKSFRSPRFIFSDHMFLYDSYVKIPKMDT